MRYQLFAFCVLSLAIPACRAAGPTSATSQPFDGITYTHEARANPPLHLHIVTVDLTRPDVELHVSPAGADPDCEGPWQTTLMPVSEIAKRDDLVVAVNGDFFMTKIGRSDGAIKVPYLVGEPARLCGIAMTDGAVWSERRGEPSLTVDDKGKVTINVLIRPSPNARQIISGSAMLVVGGKRVIDGDDKAPRTAAGIDADGKRLVLVVVDGRRPDYSAGLTMGELADEMIRMGCRWAINLDGGGSSTLVMRDEKAKEWHALNRPSDGHQVMDALSVERPVASAFGVRIKRPATQP